MPPPSTRATTTSSPQAARRLSYAKVLLEAGDVATAERETCALLEDHPDDLTALNLFAKIKHIRGEISQAVACWAQLYARSPHNEVGLMTLSTILHLAKDPERGADQFVALGQLTPGRGPLQHLELEAPFRLFLARRPQEARAQFQRLARKARDRDRELFKLAVLADAWIAELSGDLQGACTVLEALGQQRGFETDTDRVLALLRLYEHIGTPDRLRAVLNICRYIEVHFEKISILSRLAAAHRRLGEDALAAEYEARYLQAFRYRMHRPSPAEVVEVAARRYIPLWRLRRLRLPSLTTMEADLGKSPGPRERALALILRGEFAAARDLLVADPHPLSRRYLADLAALGSDQAEALRLHLQLLAEEPEVDLDVPGWLLRRWGQDRAQEIGDANAIAAALSRKEVAGPLLSRYQGAIRAAPLRAPLWEELGLLHDLLGEAEEAARCQARALVLRDAEARGARPVGRVLAAAVYHFVGKAKGLVHEVWADRKPAGRGPGQGGVLRDEDILGNLAPDLKQAVRGIFLAVREYARAKLPHLTGDILDYDYTYKVTKEDEPSGGLSAGLPSALAFLSVFLQRPVPQDMAFTGMLVTDSHDVLLVRRIGEAEYKVKGAYNRNLRALVLPLDNRQDVLRNREVPLSICDEIVRYAASLDEVVRLVFGEEVWL